MLCLEIAQIQELGVYIRFLLSSVEALTKSINFSSPLPQQPQQPSQPTQPFQMLINAAKRGSRSWLLTAFFLELISFYA